MFWQDALQEAHERAMNKAISVFNASAFGAGSARSKFEKLLQTTLRKRFEVTAAPHLLLQLTMPAITCLSH